MTILNANSFCTDFLIYIVQSVKDRILLCLNAKWGLWLISAAYFMAHYFDASLPDAACVLIPPEFKPNIKHMKNQRA